MIVNRRNRPLRAAALALGAGALLVAACADTDPVASDAPEPMPLTAETYELERAPLVLQADSIIFAAENERVLLRSSAAPTDELELVPAPNALPLPEEMKAGLVRFRANLNPDDTPASIEFDETVPAATRERVREGISTYQFRRSVATPDAPVEGAVLLP